MEALDVYEKMARDPRVKKWRAFFTDTAGVERRIHLTGPEDAQVAEVAAIQVGRNWKLIRVEATTEGPQNRQQIPAEAYQYGVLNELNQKRTR